MYEVLGEMYGNHGNWCDFVKKTSTVNHIGKYSEYQCFKMVNIVCITNALQYFQWKLV